MLRHEAHAGDQWDRGEDSLGLNWIISEGGALAWEVFPSAAMPAEKQIVNFISFMDNYNGESNLAQGATPSVWDDVSYNIQPVVTIYAIEPFNNSEDPWIPSDLDNQPIVSPVTPESPLVTAIGVKCINTYEMNPESNLNDAVLGYKFGEFALQDLFDMNSVLGTDSLTLEGFLNVLAGSTNERANEVGPGWMRLSRWFTTRKWTTTELILPSMSIPTGRDGMIQQKHPMSLRARLSLRPGRPTTCLRTSAPASGCRPLIRLRSRRGKLIAGQAACN